ncbi:MAG: Helix-turn-helix domain [Thermoleophilaceae bacterium]|jgi:transcriptional regulator with XRE-family HTH domain|nr:Helix-turn-helix domain [Thermoleophilaceae bacterium]
MNFDMSEPRPLATAPLPRGGLPGDPYYCEWAAVVGGRIRRLRRRRRATLLDLGRAVVIPGRGHYSAGFISRLERGRATAPLYVYLAIADALEVDPGLLFGPDATSLDLSEAETVLIRWLRGRKVEPHEAMLRLTEPPP